MNIETNYAWAAGIIEGEGYIGFYFSKTTSKNGYYNECYTFNLQISQTNENEDKPEMLIRFKNLFKTGNIYKKKRKTEKCKFAYTYNAYNSNAKQILRLIWPYLGTKKREQAIKAGYVP